MLSKPEKNYCVTRCELLAVVKSVFHFYNYLYGRKFLFRTDHAALKWLLQFKNPKGQVATFRQMVVVEDDWQSGEIAEAQQENSDLVGV